MSKVIYVSPSRLVTDPARNPRFAGAKDPHAAARKFYKSDDFLGLCKSFAASGIQLPIFVEKRNGSGYLVREGFSRVVWAKKQQATNPSLKVPVSVLSEKDARTAAVAMNTARVAYEPLARAASFETLLDEWGSIEKAAQKSGVNVNTVRESLRLLQLPALARKMIRRGVLSISNTNKIMRLPGWKAWRKIKDGKPVTALERTAGNEFESHVLRMLKTMKSMKDVPDVGGSWNRTKKRKSKVIDTEDIAVVVPTIDSIREACFFYGRRIARQYLQPNPDPHRIRRYRACIEHLGSSMGWCVPKALLKMLRDNDDKPLYEPRVALALRREVVAEYVLAGVITLAQREGRGFAEGDDLLDDANWQKFFRQPTSLAGRVKRLNRRLR